MQILIAAEQAVPVRRDPGAAIVLLNQSAVDIYFDENPNRLNASLAGAVPSGTRLPNTTGVITYYWPLNGVVWFRSATPTTLEANP